MASPECCSNPPTLNPNGGEGHVEKLGGINSYVTGSSNSKLAILLVSDVFGYEAPKLRKVADKVAAAGYYAVVPDFFNGEPYSRENADRPFPVWFNDHGPVSPNTDKGFEGAKVVIEDLKSRGFLAFGAAGYCWGAKVAVELAKLGVISASGLLHPAFVTLDDIKGVNIPIIVLGAEIDHMSPPELLKQFEEVLNAKTEVDSYVTVFPKVSHGWTIRYDNEDPEAVKSADLAYQKLLNWFSKHVK